MTAAVFTAAHACYRWARGLPGEKPEPECEAVQFVMGALRVPGGVALTYGVQDCESAVVTISISELRRMLAFGMQGDNASAIES